MAMGPKFGFEHEIDAQLAAFYTTGVKPTEDQTGRYFTVTVAGPLGPGDDFDITRVYVEAGWSRVWLKPGTLSTNEVQFRLYLPKRI